MLSVLICLGILAQQVGAVRDVAVNAHDISQNGLTVSNVAGLGLGALGTRGIASPIQNTRVGRGVGDAVHGIQNKMIHNPISAVANHLGF